MGPRAERIDSASRVIKASPHTLYQAFLDPTAWVVWLPPDGMQGEIQQFEATVGGSYRMVLTYEGEDHTPGKASADSDIVDGRFVELVPDVRVVQLIQFAADDPAFAGRMTMTWSLTPVPTGTEVVIACEHVPEGISASDHAAGLQSTLANLAAFVE
jgi:uncharacterized protein YndB with AHSA1/START domain